MEIFFLLPPEYLRGIVCLSDRSNSIDELHKNNLEYLTQIIESKAPPPNFFEDDKNQNLVNFKKKVQNLPKDALISIFLQYMSFIFPEFRNESLTFCKTGVLEVRSQTLKLWRDRFVKFNYQTRTFEVFKNKEKDQKNAKYTFNLGGYAIRWIDKDKCLFSLDSINYKNRYKNFIFKAKKSEILNDWYENIKFSLNFEKFNEFEFCNKKIETFNVIENFRKTEISNGVEDLLYKKRYYSKSALRANTSKKTSTKQFAETIHLSSSKTEEFKEKKLEKNLKILDDDKSYERSLAGSLIVQNIEELKSYEISGNNKKNPYLVSEEESKMSEVEEISSFQKTNLLQENPMFHNSVYSSANFHHFDKIADKFNLNKMYCENNYEMISDNGNIRIVRNLLNEKKFKLFLNLPFYFPMTPTLFLEPNFIKKWNANIVDYKILSMLSQENKLSIIYDERKKLGKLYLPRYFIYKRCVYTKNPDTTLIFCKSINYTNGQAPKLSLRGNLNFSLLSISKVNFQTKIAVFFDIDNKGFLTKHQHLTMVTEYLKNFQNIRKLLENDNLMDFSECLKFPSKRLSLKIEKPLIRIISPPPSETEEKENILLKRRSSPNFSSLIMAEDEKTASLDGELKRILQEINSNFHIINCIRQCKAKTIRNEHLPNNKYDYLFVKKFWTILTSGKFEYLDDGLINKQMHFVNSHFKENLQYNNIYLPMECLEPISELEKLANLFSFAPLIFKDLSEFDKPLDQMKVVIIFVFSLLFLSISQKIPFSSFVGETFQAKIGDFSIYVEKISENPDSSYILLINEFVVINARFRLVFDFQRNICKIRNQGFIQVFFKKNRTKFIATLPTLVIEGIREFPRTVYYEGSLIMMEKEKCLISEINFTNMETFLGFIPKKAKFNEFHGEIFTVSKKIIALANEGKSWKNEVEIEKCKKEFKVGGSLNSSIEFEEETFWSFDKHYPYYLKSVESPLPSDSKFRKDIIFYQLGINQKAELEANKLRSSEKQ